jgi:predicted DNA-binding transcriptional regulator AlpA
MENQPIVKQDALLPTRAILERYGIVERTLIRWLARTDDFDFPRPLKINRRRYFRLSEIEAWERARARATASAATAAAAAIPARA